MCGVGSSLNQSLAQVSPQATGLGAGAIGGSVLTGARRVAGGRPNTVLGGGGGGSTRPTPPRTPGPGRPGGDNSYL